MEIPKPITINTREQEKFRIGEITDNFFISVKKELEGMINVPEGPSRFEIKIRGLYSQDNPDVKSNDYIHTLMYMGELIAGVIETRTEFNFINYIFFTDLRGVIERNSPSFL